MGNYIADNLENIRSKIDTNEVTFIAVTKTQPIDILQLALDAGMDKFGENKVQDMCTKHELLPKNIQWHMIGHLQTNKVKYIAGFVAYIHSVDSLKLLTEINKQAAKYERVINCLLQVYIANEDTKFGLSESEALELLENDTLKAMKNIKIKGLMGMATNTTDTQQISQEFANLKHFYEKTKKYNNSYNIDIQELSMGMSNDYSIAVAQGSTMVRVGSALFSKKN
jgi:PLP dependent protein